MERHCSKAKIMRTGTLLLYINLLIVHVSLISCKPSTSNHSNVKQGLHFKHGVKPPAQKSSRYGVPDPELYMDAHDLITSKGYPCENHIVTTADGYIMNMFRIPHGKSKSKRTNGDQPVVILQHGLLGSCTNWLTNLANQSLAYLLADAGADVWLGNSRGNRYALGHTHLDSNSTAYWQFNFDDMAKYDLPAMLNYVTQFAGVDQVYYAGHSQGTTIGFAGFEDPKIAAKVKHFFALAPVARIGNNTSFLANLAPIINTPIVEIFGHKQFLLENDQLRILTGALCDSVIPGVCDNIIFALNEFDFQSMNKSRIPIYISHNPAGTSVQDMRHWAQMILSGKWARFDYGSAAANMKIYNQTTPPLYEPSKIKVPVAIFRGGDDSLADDEDVNWLLPQLNVTKDVYIKHYKHLDLIWAIDAPKYIYNDMMDIIFPKK